MGSITKHHTNRTIWFQKTWDLTHGYGYHIQIYWKKYSDVLNRMIHDDISYGFSKNKFTALKMALNKIDSNRNNPDVGFY